MKVVIERNQLLPAVQNVIGAIQTKSSLTVLTFLHAKGDGETITLMGTDLETTLRSRFTAHHEPFELLLPAKRLSDILKALPDGFVGMEQSEDKVTLKSGKSRYKLATIDVGEYPAPPDNEFDESFIINQAKLRNLIVYTEHAMAKKDVRYYLNGQCWQLIENQLNVCCSDGHRLAKISEVLNHRPNEPKEIIVPFQATQELKKLLAKEGDAECTVKIGMNHVAVDMGDIQFQSKLIDGKFPDFSRVIPKEIKFTIPIGREAFLNAVNRVSLIIDTNVGVALEFSENLLSLKAMSNGEESEEQVEVTTSEQFVIGFNAYYLLDIAKVMRSEVINLNFTDAQSAMMIDSPESDEGVYVVMPMRL
jgi:DNA polymerase-3 subunit beta